jgi:hypothetical protein
MPRCSEKISGTGLIRRLAFAFLLLATYTDAVSQHSENVDDAKLHKVFVYLTTQEGLLEPGAMGSEMGLGFWDPFLIHTSIHEWQTKTGRNDVQRLRNSLRSALGPFHFESSTLNILEAVEANADWEVWDTEVVDSITTISHLAKRAFRETPVDHVLAVDARYFMSPGLDQVRLVVYIKLVPNTGQVGRPQALFERQYEYLSQGEKEALAAKIEENYRRLSEDHPENAATYDEEKSRALERLSKREVIPPDLAVLEAWPGRSLALVVGEAERHMQHMMLLDFRVLRGPKPEQGARVRFERLDASGDPYTESGYLVGTFEDNTIYRDRKRNMYSIP